MCQQAKFAYLSRVKWLPAYHKNFCDRKATSQDCELGPADPNRGNELGTEDKPMLPRTARAQIRRGWRSPSKWVAKALVEADGDGDHNSKGERERSKREPKTQAFGQTDNQRGPVELEERSPIGWMGSPFFS